MTPKHATRCAATLLFIASLTTFAACNQDPVPGKAPAAATDSHGHGGADAHAHDHDQAGSDHAMASASGHGDGHGDGHGHGHGPVVELGSTSIGGFQVVVTRDAGAITAGGEAAIDATVTGGSTKVTAVRFWIGTADARGSLKARAENEDPKDATRWHSHVEVPSPMPSGSALWIEIENDKGEKIAGSVELRT